MITNPHNLEKKTITSLEKIQNALQKKESCV